MWIHTFRAYLEGWDWGQGTVGTTRGTGDELRHIRMHWVHTFGVYL